MGLKLYVYIFLPTILPEVPDTENGKTGYDCRAGVAFSTEKDFNWLLRISSDNRLWRKPEMCLRSCGGFGHLTMMFRLTE